MIIPWRLGHDGYPLLRFLAVPVSRAVCSSTKTNCYTFWTTPWFWRKNYGSCLSPLTNSMICSTVGDSRNILWFIKSGIDLSQSSVKYSGHLTSLGRRKGPQEVRRFGTSGVFVSNFRTTKPFSASEVWYASDLVPSSLKREKNLESWKKVSDHWTRRTSNVPAAHKERMWRKEGLFVMFRKRRE